MELLESTRKLHANAWLEHHHWNRVMQSSALACGGVLWFMMLSRGGHMWTFEVNMIAKDASTSIGICLAEYMSQLR